MEIKEAKGFTPSGLAKRPPYPGAHSRHLEAFRVLSAGRLVQEFPQPISESDILSHAVLMGIRPGTDQAEDLLQFTRLLDSVYLNHWAKKHEARQNAK